MKKQIFRLLLVLVLAASLVPMGAFGAGEPEIVASGNFGLAYGNAMTWKLDNAGTLTVSGSGDMPRYIQPWTEHVNAIKKAVIEPGVTSIGAGAFSGCCNLKEITIPEGVTQIEEYAFGECHALTAVTIPQGVTSIGYNAFFGCSALKAVVIPSKVTVIDNGTFSGCSSLTSVTLPEGVGSIRGEAFSRCGALASIVLPGTVIEIYDDAFESCGMLQTVVFRGDAPEFGSWAFSSVVADVYYPEGNPTWTEETRQNYGGTLTWKAICAGEHSWQDATCTAPKTCTVCAITEGTVLAHNLISHEGKEPSCTENGWKPYVACSRCDYSTYEEIYDPVHHWLDATCTQPETCAGCGETRGSAIGHDYENYICTRCGDVDYRAEGTSGDITWTLTWDGILTISGNGPMPDLGRPWRDYSEYIQKAVIEPGITSICEGAFWGCSNLTDVTIPEGIEIIDEHAFYECSSLKHVVIPGTVAEIGPWAFSGCSSLSDVTLSQGVQRIGGYAFSYCSSLTSILIPESVTAIDHNAFHGCSALESVTIPGSVSEIGQGAFEDCGSLTSITIPQGIQKLEKNVFSGCSSLSSVTIPDSITMIESEAFMGCSSLKRITLPNGVTGIGVSVFKGCTSLTEIIIPAGVTCIEKNAFWGCTGLKTVTIREGVKTIDEYAFNGCSSLTDVTIPGSVTDIGIHAFNGCSSLARITIPDSVTGIGAYAFYNCIGLTEVSLPKGLTAIENGTFSGCSRLSAIALPESVTRIGGGAFYECTSLTSITIPKAVASIGDYAFYDCKALTRIDFLGSLPAMSNRGLGGAFSGVRAEAYVLAGDESWEAFVGRSNTYFYGGTMTFWERPDIQSTCTFTQASVSLAGDIGLNYYAELSENIVSDPGAFMRFTFDNQVQDVPVRQAIRQKDGTYRFSCYLAAKDMACRVTAQMHTSRGTVGEAKTYSVRDYCTAIIRAYGNTASQAKLVNLLRSMLNYGTQSQASLGHNTMDLANSGLSAADRVLPNPTDLAAYAHSAVGTEEGIQVASASLILRTTTTIRVYFQLTGDKTIDQYSFTAGGKAVSPVHHSGKQYYVDLVGIEARNLDTMYQITCGGITVSYCGLSYVKSTLEYPGFTEDAKNMARALYGYAMAANEYFGN